MASAVDRDKADISRVVIAAKPTRFELDPARAAVLVIDMQNDFVAEGGMFEHAGIDIAMIRRVVAPTARVLAAARRAGIAVVYLKMAFKPDLSDAGPVGSPNRVRHLALGAGTPVKAPDGSSSRILVRDTWNTEIVAELAPHPGDCVLYKHRFSGFFGTDLHATLRRRGISQLLVTGCTTSIDVESTIRDAMFRDYSCLLLEDCCGEPIGYSFGRSNHDASLLNVLLQLGWIASSDDLVQSIDAMPLPASNHPITRESV